MGNIIKILLLDDQTYGIQQILNSIPKDIIYVFHYSNSVEGMQGDIEYDITLLDYYLDRDGILGTEVVQKILSKNLIGFASDKENSKKIALLSKDGLPIQKLRNSVENMELKRIFEKIISSSKYQ